MSNEIMQLLLKDYIAELIETAEEVKDDYEGGDFRNGQLLAYNTALSRLKIILSPDADNYGLDFDIDKRFA
jgi:hypothetical protein